MKTLGWGILGTGNIAQQFAADLRFAPDAKLIAVGSRSQETARVFGERFGIPLQYAGYQHLASDPDIQAVYIATPPSLHKDHALLCLKAGKAVVCEKPFTLNANEAKEMIAVARENQAFLMEGRWTRFIPAIVKARELLAAGAIGDPRLLEADFGVRSVFDPDGLAFSPTLGGGALLSVGVYLLSLASMIFGTPTKISSLAHRGQTGVDEESAVLLGYPQGQMAVLLCTIRARTPRQALVVGTKGAIKIHAPFNCPTRLRLTVDSHTNKSARNSGMRAHYRFRDRLVDYGRTSRMMRAVYARYWDLAQRILHGARSEAIHVPLTGKGLHYQASEVMKCLRAGQMESEVMPLDESLAIMRTLDEVRQQW